MTKGKFWNDQTVQKVIRHTADFQKTDFRQMLQKNENLKKHLDRQTTIEHKKLTNNKIVKQNLDREVRLKMAIHERKFAKQNLLTLRSTFFKDPK